MLRRFLIALVLVIFQAQPAWCVAQKMVQEGSPLVIQATGKIEQFSAQIKVPTEYKANPLYLTFYNGYGAKPGFSWARVVLNAPGQPASQFGQILVDQRTFLQKHATTIDVSGSLSDSGNQLYIEGEGEAGAELTWVLSTVKDNLSVVDSTSVSPGKTFYIHGTGFSTNKQDNQVELGGKPAEVLDSTARVLTVKAPDTMDTTSPSSRLTVSVNGKTSNAIQAPFHILPPTLLNMSPYGGPMGGILNIRGTNFSPVPDQNVVQIGPFNAPVIQVMDTGTLLVRIPNWGSSSGTLPVRVTTNGVPSTNYLQFWCTPHYYGGDPNAAVYQYD